MEILYEGVLGLFQNGGWQRVVMWLIGALLIYLAIFGEDHLRKGTRIHVGLDSGL